MGLGAKLTFAFITVIVIMVATSSGYALVADYLTSKNAAQTRCRNAVQRLIEQFRKITDENQQAASALAHDPKLLESVAAKNREATAKSIKDFVDRTGLIAFVSIIDDKGTLFYSTEAPAKFGQMVRNDSAAIDYVLLNNNLWKGPATFGPTSLITISTMMPMPMSPGTIGVMAVSQPVNSELLTGMVTKFALDPDHLTGVDMALISNKDNKVVAVTPGLVNNDGGYLTKINQTGLKSIPLAVFEANGRMWQPFPLEQGKGNMLAEILVSTPAPNLMDKLPIIAGQIGIAGGIAFVLSLLFTVGITSGVQKPLSFLTQRARDLASGKASLGPLEGLSAEWLELGELMDTSVASMRSSVQSLKSQLQKHNQELDEKLKTAETSSSQLDGLNKQLSDKTRQLAEVSKQVNYANQQTVLLQHKLDSVLQISTEGYLILDQYGNVLSANPVFLQWMGVSEGEIAGQLCFDLVRKPGEPRSPANQPKAFARHSGNPADLITQFYPEGVVYHRYKDKSVEVLAHLQPVVTDDANIQAYIMVLRDKTLRSEITQLKTEIVAMLSDSIRAPLAGAEGTWKSILNSAAQTMHPSVGQSLAQLHSHYEQLIGLVDSLLMMYGGIIPPPVIPKEQIVITRLIADCLEEVSTKARDRQLALDYKTVTGLPPVFIDKDTIRKVTIQLLDKAMEITAAGGRVRVETLIKGSEMRVGFYSSGPALPKAEIEEMFIGFIPEKHKEETYSTRLSMYLARNSIEKLGGKIWAETQEGRGTAIFFIIAIS